MYLTLSRLAFHGVLVVVLAALPAYSQTRKETGPAAVRVDTSALDAYLRYLFLWPPEVKIEFGEPKPSEIPGLSEIAFTVSAQGGSIQQSLLITSDGTRIIRGTVYDLRKNPFADEAAKISTAGYPSLGAANAPVTLVVFTDYQCPYCREEAKVLRGNLMQNYPKEVRLVLKDFPLEQIHPWAKQAAVAAHCILQQNRDIFWQYHDWVFEQQGQITPQNLNSKVMEFARGRAIDSLQLNRCLQTKATEAEVDRSMQEARSLQVDATPTLFINGRKIAQQLSWQQLKNVIESELAYLRRTAGAETAKTPSGSR